MFRELSNEESELVKKWQPPLLSDSKQPARLQADNDNQTIGLEEFSTTDISSLRNGISDVQQQQLNESQGNHASLTMVSPSPDILQQTYDEGFAAGVQAEKSNAEASAANDVFKLLDKLTAQHYQIDADIEREVLSLAKSMARLILRREVESDDTTLIAIVRNALAQLPITSDAPTVILHPDDLNLLQNLQTNPIAATLVPDNDMARGDCLIKSGSSILDAGVDALVNSISSRLDNPSQIDSSTESSIENVDAQVV